METCLPTGESVRSRFPGYIVHRHIFDKHLVSLAVRGGAQLLTGTRATRLDGNRLTIRTRGGFTRELAAKVVIGADGPLSCVGSAVNQRNSEFLLAAQYEVVLDGPIACTSVYFDPDYVGGYGWVFPKGLTANVGIGVARVRGGSASPAEASLRSVVAQRSSLTGMLDAFLEKLSLGLRGVVGRTAGLVPVGGPVRTTVGHVLLAGDAAGHTHPMTGAGILHAVIGGDAAGRAAARAVREDDLEVLSDYDQEWQGTFGRVLGRALERRRLMVLGWSRDPQALSAVLRDTWMAFHPPRIQR